MKERKIIVITGVTRGLGLALAEKYIQDGHTVLGCGRSADAIDELNDRYTSNHEFETVDVTNALSVNQWAAHIIKTWAPPDYLINNAAIINQNAPLWEVPADEFSNLIDINVKGVFNTIKAFVPAMIRKGSGVIVNFSSEWGRTTSADVAPYCTSKFAVEGMSQALAKELPANMASIALSPGVIDTEMLRSCLPGMAPSCPSPEQWAETAAPYILSLGAGDNGGSLSVH